MSPLAVPPHVLVAEHDSTQRDLLALLLQREDVTSDTAASLEAACEKVDQELYDLVLTDVFSPFPPRLEAVMQLRQRCYPTPVGIVSGWRIKEQEAERAGFAFVLGKPFDLETVLERIACYLAPTLSPLQQEQATRITVCLDGPLNARHRDALQALWTPEVASLSLRRSLFPTAGVIFGQETILAQVQRALDTLPEMRVDHRTVVPHRGQLVTRFRSRWQGPDEQRQQLAGSAHFRFRGEQISRIGVALNPRRLRTVLKHG